MKKSTIAAGLKAAAEAQAPKHSRKSARPAPGAKTVLIGAHFLPEVRQALFLVQAEPANQGKNLKQLLGEAINDLCSKYHKTEPYTGEP